MSVNGVSRLCGLFPEQTNLSYGHVCRSFQGHPRHQAKIKDHRGGPPDSLNRFPPEQEPNIPLPGISDRADGRDSSLRFILEIVRIKSVGIGFHGKDGGRPGGFLACHSL